MKPDLMPTHCQHPTYICTALSWVGIYCSYPTQNKQDNAQPTQCLLPKSTQTNKSQSTHPDLEMQFL